MPLDERAIVTEGLFQIGEPNADKDAASASVAGEYGEVWETGGGLGLWLAWGLTVLVSRLSLLVEQCVQLDVS